MGNFHNLPWIDPLQPGRAEIKIQLVLQTLNKDATRLVRLEEDLEKKRKWTRYKALNQIKPSSNTT